jgi:hypothetical protein
MAQEDHYLSAGQTAFVVANLTKRLGKVAGANIFL